MTREQVKLEPVRILESLVRIPSVTGQEANIAAAVAQWCEEAGLEVELRQVTAGRTNVLAHWNAGAATCLLLTGHMDTVPIGEGWTRDPFAAEISGGRLFGRGACDMKGGLAAMLSALFGARKRGSRLDRNVMLAAVVGEEEDSIGTRALVRSGIQAECAIVAEPTNLELVRSNRGLINFRLSVSGTSAHASSPELGRNAIVVAADLVLELEALARRLEQQLHPTLGKPNLTVGTIHGGTRPYVVPDSCVIEVDRRLNPGETPEGALAEIAQASRKVRHRWPDVSIELTLGSEYLPFEVSEGHPLVGQVSAAMEASGLHARTGTWRAASDAGFLVVERGIPTVLFGPGNISLAAHRPDEFVDLAQVEVAAEVYWRMLHGRSIVGGSS
jgi:acetylornithine deacetylase/succinyl-diaminopimelate desuccinylase family protein